MSEKKSTTPDNIVLYYGEIRPTIFTMRGEIGRIYKTNKKLEFKGEESQKDMSDLSVSKLVPKRIRPLDYFFQWLVITALVLVNTTITGATPAIAPIYGVLALPLIFLITRLGQRVVKVEYKDDGVDREAYFSNFRGATYDHFRDFADRKDK